MSQQHLFTFVCLSVVCVLGVELLFQPHCPLHQPAQPAAGSAWPCKEKESP